MNSPAADLLEVLPWRDPVIEAAGYAINDPYIEMFWLPILGPTATWLIRRLASGLEHEPQGYTISMTSLARGIGVSFSDGKHNPFGRALQRCIMFGVSHNVPSTSHQIVAVRNVLPQLSQRHLGRLPDELRSLHNIWRPICV
jgi:hypothetical protein